MTDQEAENVAASVRHLLIQRGIDAREWERQAGQWKADADQQRKDLDVAQRQLAELMHLVGAETPIAAFDLATTWQAEKALLREEIESLKRRLDELHRAVWIAQDDEGARYCTLCEQRHPDHYHSCAFDPPAAAALGETHEHP